MRSLQQSIRLALTSTTLSSSFVASFPSLSSAIMTSSTTTSSVKNSTSTAAVARTALEEAGKTGEFLRTASVYRNWISKGMQLGVYKTFVSCASCSLLYTLHLSLFFVRYCMQTRERNTHQKRTAIISMWPTPVLGPIVR